MPYIASLIIQVVQFIIKTRKIRHLKQYSLACIGNMDEIPLWMDMPGETTISRAGERTISICTTGHDKGRFTVVLAAMADGRKLKPYVVFKGVRPVTELARIPRVVVAYSRNGWMNEELTKDWISRTCGLLAFDQCLLVWDAYKCHITDAITSHAKRSAKTDVSIIPGGLTRHLQPAGVSWNKPFKEAYKVLYNDWMATGEKSYTVASNMRAPDKALCLRWVKEAWSSVTAEVVIKSFRVYGISVKTDGSEDGEIHCIKEGQAAAEVSHTIAEKAVSLFEDATEDDNCDPFSESDLEEDEDELADNELAVEDC